MICKKLKKEIEEAVEDQLDFIHEALNNYLEENVVPEITGENGEMNTYRMCQEALGYARKVFFKT